MPRSFERRFGPLLANTARLLDVQLEVWRRPTPTFATARPPLACVECAAKTAPLASDCRSERWRQTARASDRETVQTWSCPRGLTLHAAPLRGVARGPAAIVAVSASAGAGCDETPSVHARKSGRRRKRERRFLADLARLLSDQMTLVSQHSVLEGELSDRYDELQMLSTVSGRLASHEDMLRGLRTLAERTRDAVGADQALLLSRERHLSEVLSRPDCMEAIGLSARRWAPLVRELQEWIESEGPGSRLLSTERLGEAPPLPIGAVAVARLHLRGRPVGLFAVVKFGRDATFRLSDLKLLETVAQQASLALANGELYEDLQAFLMATVKCLVNAIEAKDSYTSGHSERVQVVSLLLGRTLGLSPAELETLRWASILHDIGKIGMPECILHKPGGLDQEELAIMREHPDRGYHVLAPISQLHEAALGVRAHHERYDGAGYPLRLSGREIPLLARIITVADAHDALTTDRPYRRATPPDFARGEILRGRGSQFDPEIVDAFVQLFPFLRDNHAMIHAAIDSGPSEAAA